MLACLLTGKAVKEIDAADLNKIGVSVHKLTIPRNYQDLQKIYYDIIYPNYISNTPAVFALENRDRYLKAIQQITDPFPVACPLTAEKVIRHLNRLPVIDSIKKARFPQQKPREHPQVPGLKLDAEQAAAAAHYLGSALTIAPAGSGKTSTLVARIVLLVKRGIKPQHILCLTFTRKAQHEMQERLVKILGEPGKSVMVKTYHALVYQLISEYQKKTPNLIPDKYKILQDLMYEDSFDYNLSLDDADAFIGLQMNNLVPPEQVKCDKEDHWQMKRLYEKYRGYLEKHRLYDQDFLLVKLYEMFRDNPKYRQALMDYTDSGAPAGYPSGRWHFVLVDECQDNNLAQDALTRFFAAPWDNVFYVGDEDQLLYTFRGSSVERILNLKKNYPCLKEMYLKTNYRSRPGIVKAADILIRINTMRRPKEIIPFREDVPGVIKSAYFSNAGEEYAWIAAEIKSLIETGTKPEDIGVLYRVNVQGDALALSLQDTSLPHYLHKNGPSLFQCAEVRALLDHITLVLPEYRHPEKHDEFRTALLRCLAIPKRTEKILSYEEILYEDPPSDPLRAVTKLAAKMDDSRVLDLCHQLSNMNLITMPNAGLVVSFVREKFLNSWYRGESEQERMDIIESIAAKFRKAADFVKWVRKINASDKKADIHGVQLMTVHSAKGLEFPIVYLMNCTEGYFPYSKSVKEGNLEEERRVFYVGMTRAKDMLYLTGYKEKKKQLSRYLTDLANAGVIRDAAVNQTR